jgi:O-antigen biosynthesis protein
VNPVLILTHNNLELTKRCVESVKKQYPRADDFIVDNGSSDGTVFWANDRCSLLDVAPDNVGVSAGWNAGLTQLFYYHKAQYVLVLNNDTVLPPWFYSELLSYDLPFVTGVAVDKMEQISKRPPPLIHTKMLATDTLFGPVVDLDKILDPHPDFSAFLIRRDAWEAVGPFDERMKLYASDCDWHVRAHRAGIKLWKANVPFYHERSSTLRLAPPDERIEIETQANKDRAVFKSLYGCLPGEPAYYELFK